MQAWLVVFGLVLDIWGVLLIIREWRLAVLGDRMHALKSDITFYRNLRHKFTQEEAANVQRARLSSELELGRILSEANELSGRYERREILMRRGRSFIVAGFVLQILGSIPISQLCPAGIETCILIGNREVIVWFSSLTMVGVCVWGVIILYSRVRRKKLVVNDEAFTGEFFSGEQQATAGLHFLRLNIKCTNGKIIGVTHPNSTEASEVERFLEVAGSCGPEGAEIHVTDFAGSEPYPYARALLKLEGRALVWQLKDDLIGGFPRLSTLRRLSM